MELSERRKKILSIVVEEYIETAEPVGSKTVLQRGCLSCSSATVRNDLAALEQEGYLEQPHTSAGRIPTAKGYRFYVNELMKEQKLTAEETEQINATLSSKIEELDKLMSDVGNLASELTHYPALAVTSGTPATIKRFDLIYIDQNTFIIVLLLSNNAVKNKLIHLPFSFEEDMIRRLSAVFNASFTGIKDDEITTNLIVSTERSVGDVMGLTSVIAGFAIDVLSSTKVSEGVISGSENLLKLPEFQDPTKAHKLMSYLSTSADFNNLPNLSPSGDVKVLIGPENVAEELKDSSVILASYDAGDNMKGIIGVVGPTRMDYSNVAAKLSYIAEGLSQLLGGSSRPPTGFGKLMIKGDDS